MERKVRDSCGKNVSRGDPAGGSRGGSTDRPRKASAWSGNQDHHQITFLGSGVSIPEPLF
ncbi:hypothetical protein RCO48_15610 [Peribacillus frigoritolerans]|nr:hypothetical protein [Peribacillus frigoritolerans]